MQPGRDRQLVTAAVMLGMFLAALEATAVAAAVPTAVGTMGGVARYSWVFSAYLLTSTTTVPLYGKLADLFGRRRIYLFSVALFLLGSALSGLSASLVQLIVFRGIQGLGAGGLMPVAATVIGDVFSLEERGRMQGLFSSVWAFASLVGPLAGGLLTDALSWRWIFFINIPFGLASAWLLERHLKEEPPRREHRLDVLGTVLLTIAVALLLLALIEGPEIWGWRDPKTLAALAGALAAGIGFVIQERHAPEPTLPLDLFRSRIIAVASVCNVLIGALLFAVTAFVPMLGQGVLGGSATDAGTILTPLLIGWPIASTLSGRLIAWMPYRRMALIGGSLLALAGAFLARLGPATTRTQVIGALFVAGFGLGFLSMPSLLSVQSAVPWRRRGVATGSVQFFRSIGGAIGVAALGALFAARLRLAAGPGADPNALLDPALRRSISPLELAHLTSAFLTALEAVFFGIGVLAAATLVVAALFPAGRAREHLFVEDAAPSPELPEIMP
ncbi:MAG TPA: MDR family MFS transporter [Thermoanaerobaculia bacterium]|nr:MDR family MFS transporter [Thermoanaerobaculia bacterium]